MSSTTDPLPTDQSGSISLDYRLTEADVHHYCVASRTGKCWRSCRQRRFAWLLLGLLTLLIVGLCYQRKGIRAGGLVFGTGLVVLTVLAWSHQALADRLVGRLARQMGLPRDLHLILSTDGILERPGPDAINPERVFKWSEVVTISRIDRLTILRLRPAGGVLIIPDRAFPSPKSRAEFGEFVRKFQAHPEIKS